MDRQGAPVVDRRLVALAVVGAIYQAIAMQRDERAYPLPGELVEVGDQCMHTNRVSDKATLLRG